VIGKGGNCIKHLIEEFGVRIAVPLEKQVLPGDKDKFPFIYIGGDDPKKVHEATIRVFELVLMSMSRERGMLLRVKNNVDELGSELQYKDLKIFEQKEQIAELKISAGVESEGEEEEEEEETGITMSCGSSSATSLPYAAFGQ